MKSKSILFATLFSVGVVLSLNACGSSNTNNETYSESQTRTQSRNKSVNAAISNHDIHYGMTMQEVIDIIGHPDKAVDEGGNMWAWYYNGRSYPLRFNNGKLSAM